MSSIYLFIFSQICLINLVSAQVLCLDESNRKPVSEVILLDGNGGVIDLTDGQGVAKSITSTTESSSPVTFSHMAYEPVVKTVQAGDTIWLTPRSFVLPEAVVLAVDPNADFVKLSTLVRSYQYIEEVPAYFTEAIVDFLIPKKGNKLTYQLHSVRAYRNDKLIEESGTESGSLRMAQNGLTNFLLNTPFPLSHNYEVRSAETPSSYYIYLNGVKKGEIQLTTAGEYAVNMDMLTEKGSRPRSLFGRTNTLKRKQIRQTISDYTQDDAISPINFISYRLVTDLSTKYKDADEVSLLNISEIYVLSKEGLSKQQVKSLKTGDDFGTFKQSLHPEASEWDTLPTYIPKVVEVIQKSLNQELKLMQ